MTPNNHRREYLRWNSFLRHSYCLLSCRRRNNVDVRPEVGSCSKLSLLVKNPWWESAQAHKGREAATCTFRHPSEPSNSRLLRRPIVSMPFNHGRGAEDVDDHGMTPRSFQATAAPTASPNPSISTISSPPPSPVEITRESSMPVVQSRPHGKRRDPSYIPRPPNAFILFRSAFIREQNIPGKVEGNHSKLSKIIGICWRQLPREEREKWEAQAVIAQAEHRARYPDWRFRPGANAMAKLKVSETSSSTARRRSVRSRVKSSPMRDDNDGDSEIKVKDKGKGKTKANRLPSIEETRCAKIAGFVGEGLKGDELEVAVKQWEDDRRISRPETRPKKPRISKSRTAILKAHSRSQSDAFLSSLPSSSPKESQSDQVSNSSTPTRTQRLRTPTLEDKDKSGASSNAASSIVGLSDVPLTHMFKRSDSVSASTERLSRPRTSSDPSDESSAEDVSSSSAGQSPVAWGMVKTSEEAPPRTHTNPHIRPDSTSVPIPSNPPTTPFDGTHLTWQEAENRRRFEEPSTSDSWWTGRSTPVRTEFSFSEQKERQSGTLVLPSENIGFNAECSGSQYTEQYRPFESTRDCNHHVGWTNMSGINREGIVTVVADPYDDDREDNPPPVLSQPQTLSLPPPSDANFYHSSTSQSAWLPSSYSALNGWDGDYKHHQLQESWPDQAVSDPQAHGSTDWYTSQGTMYNWTGNRPQLHHTLLSVDPRDWDRVEGQAMSEHHPSEPPRQFPFHDELRPPRGGS